MDEPWTLPELAAEAARLLSGDRPARPGGRARDLPNERMIRWYATIGVMDPPLRRRGRVALYGTRHLLQLLAVKRRQAEGRSLTEIQAELAGATDAALREIARVPGRLGADGPPDDGPPADGPPAGTRTPGPVAGVRAAGPASAAAAPERPPAPATPAEPREVAASGSETGDMVRGVRTAPRRFWAERPATDAGTVTESATGSTTGAAAGPAGEFPPAAGDAADATPGAGQVPAGALVHAVRLTSGATLLLPSLATPEDTAAIVAAAGPLIELLRERGLA